MIELALLTLLISEHNYSHWDMSCSEWNQKRIEILSDKNLNSDAHEYLIDYLKFYQAFQKYILSHKLIIIKNLNDLYLSI